jgi:hypothetical protein
MRGEMVVRDVERQFETEAVVSRVVSKMQDGPASRRHRQARRARIPYGSSTKLSRASIEVPTMVTAMVPTCIIIGTMEVGPVLLKTYSNQKKRSTI